MYTIKKTDKNKAIRRFLLKHEKEGDVLMLDYLNAFWVGGIICVIAQILIDKTKLTPARILVAFVVLGVVLGAVGLYEPIVDFAGAAQRFRFPVLAIPWPRVSERR